MTLHIDPRCNAELEFLIRRDAAAKGIQVMPSRPFPWNRSEYRKLVHRANAAVGYFKPLKGYYTGA